MISKRGVKQEDPLAPFLFILAMEGLNVIIKSVINNNLLKGVQLPNNGPVISHVMYADDAMFISDLNAVDMVNLTRILQCFHILPA